jgi:hypothetical protein
MKDIELSREQERLDETLDALPKDIVTGLEVGFNDCRVTKYLRDKIDLVSIDLPRDVHNPDGYRLAFADIQSLPFTDKAFDIVICTEVLEHLPVDVLLRGVEELQRVSRRYVLVSVPYQQRVWNETFKCSNCGYVGNSMGHLHYMDERKVDGLFRKASRVKTDMVGRIAGYAPDWLYKASNLFGNAWSNFAAGVCPACQLSDRAVGPNPIGFVLQRLIWRIEDRVKARPAWVVMLFRV